VGFVVLPSIDISGGRSVRPVRIHGGRDSDDPVEIACFFASAGARRLHVVDLEGARTGRAGDRDTLLEVVRAAPCPVQAAGGLTGVDDVEQVLAAGATVAAMGAFALGDHDEVVKACRAHRGRVAGVLDVRGTGPWAQRSVGGGASVADAARGFEEAGASLRIVVDVGAEGRGEGPDVEGLAVVRSLTQLPLVASGGITSLGELRAVVALAPQGFTGAVVGRALHEGRFALAEANAVASEVGGR
jgi:phosphoribosylformimino-5-aminoimidazole carboxamide ribotide isomerase